MKVYAEPLAVPDSDATAPEHLEAKRLLKAAGLFPAASDGGNYAPISLVREF